MSVEEQLSALMEKYTELQAENKQQSDFLVLAKEEMDELHAKNEKLKEGHRQPHKCEGCDEIIYYQDYCSRCKRQWES